MPKATWSNGKLAPILNCYIRVPPYTIILNNLPEISDNKTANYNAEAIIGRSSPLHTYHHSDTRMISMTIHFFILQDGDAQKNLTDLRTIQSAAYPRSTTTGAPFMPPVICTLKCGSLLGDSEVCAILQNYAVRYPTDVAWDATTMVPYKFDIDTNWWVVYPSPNLPDNNKILMSGY